MKAQFAIALIALFIHSARAAETTHEQPVTATETTVAADGFAKIPIEAQSADAKHYQHEDSVSALMLSLWSLSAGQIPPKELLTTAGLDETAVKSFVKGLGPNSKLNSADRELLRKSFAKDSFEQRNAARNKYLSFISKFQDKFPGTANVIPELVTVWGEARNIRGFEDIDSVNQQAKMATVIHVIRNRTEKRNQRFPNAPAHKNKWNVVTRRFQFSAFEPYDPNFAELALGPMGSTPYTNVNALPRNDQIAIRNLAKVVAGLNRGEIQLAKPLVYNNTYHYLTPSLLDYTKENIAMLRSQIERTSDRLAIIKIPTQNPQYLTAVPRWSRQKALISHPPVRIKDPVKNSFQTQIVSPTDFIYFRGIP